MSISVENLRRLSALNLSTEDFQEVLSIIADMQEGHEARRQAARDRTAKWRESQDQKRIRDVTVISPERHEERHDPLSSLFSLTEGSLEEERKEGSLQSGRARSAKAVPKMWKDDAEFREWYSRYPRHEAPSAAHRAYRSVLAKGLATPPELLAGASRYADKVRGADQKFTKAPAVWLNGGCWDDQPGHGPPAAEQRPCVTIRFDSPQARAWERHNGKPFAWGLRGEREVPSEWPPGHETPATGELLLRMNGGHIP